MVRDCKHLHVVRGYTEVDRQRELPKYHATKA